jgi:hypothetical protein
MPAYTRVTAKQKAAVTMRVSGAPLDKIVEIVGFRSIEEAQRAIEQALAGVVEPEDFDTARALYLSRLDALLAACWQHAVDPKDLDQISYVKTVLAIEERRAKLTGADSPVRHEIYTPTAEQIEAHVGAYMRNHPDAIVEAEIVEELSVDHFDDQPALPMEV